MLSAFSVNRSTTRIQLVKVNIKYSEKFCDCIFPGKSCCSGYTRFSRSGCDSVKATKQKTAKILCEKFQNKKIQMM